MNVDLRKRVEDLESAMAEAQAQIAMLLEAGNEKQEKPKSGARKLHEKPEE